MDTDVLVTHRQPFWRVRGDYQAESLHAEIHSVKPEAALEDWGISEREV